MRRSEVTVVTPDGTCRATLHTPEGPGPWPGVLYYPDAGGVREVFSAMADTVAGWGYAVLLPDIYYRTPYAPFDTSTLFGDAEEFARLSALGRTLTPPLMTADAQAYLSALIAHDDVVGTRAGVVGYCFGGAMALRAIGDHPELVATVATFHGGFLAVADDPASPHLLAPRMDGPVYVGAATDDASFDGDHQLLLRQACEDAAVPLTIEVYPAAHGFAVPDNPTHDDAADERHRQAMAAVLAASLGEPA
jgi:carboxymethylenebutenolidase